MKGFNLIELMIIIAIIGLIGISVSISINKSKSKHFNCDSQRSLKVGLVSKECLKVFLSEK